MMSGSPSRLPPSGGWGSAIPVPLLAEQLPMSLRHQMPNRGTDLLNEWEGIGEMVLHETYSIIVKVVGRPDRNREREPAAARRRELSRHACCSPTDPALEVPA